MLTAYLLTSEWLNFVQRLRLELLCEKLPHFHVPSRQKRVDRRIRVSGPSACPEGGIGGRCCRQTTHAHTERHTNRKPVSGHPDTSPVHTHTPPGLWQPPARSVGLMPHRTWKITPDRSLYRLDRPAPPGLVLLHREKFQTDNSTGRN